MNTHLSPTNTVELAAWNIQAGGFNEYVNPDLVPSRGPAIRNEISSMRADGVDTLCLTDAFQWDQTYGGDRGIARQVGLANARFVPLEDSRLHYGNPDSQIGIVLASNHDIHSSRTLDLGNRNALGIVLDIGKHGLQIAGVYLDDLDEGVRRQQVKALFAELTPDVPTVLTGDFNTLRDDMTGGSLRTKFGDLAVRAAARLIPASKPIGQSIRGMNQRTVIPAVEALGYRDADPRKRPTAPAAFPAFGIDYIFAGRGVATSNFRTWNAKGASDHRPIRATITF